MKNLKFLLVLLISLAAFTPFNETKAQSINISFSNFQRELSPYGRWQNNPRYGQVWVYNEPNFRPYYSNGYWDYTEYGWEWVSNYDWGWAPFHYGRWEYDPYDGWMWIPGYDWAPAWVSWSSYDGYYGWAPMGYGLSVNISFGSIPYDRWTFIPRQNICDRNISRYYVSPQRNYGFRNAVIINNVYNTNVYNGDRGGRDCRFFRGPDRNEVQRYTNNHIEERKVDHREKTGAYRRGDNNGRWNDNRNERQTPTVFDRMNKGQDDVRNNDQQARNNSQQNNNFPQRQSQHREQEQRDKVKVFDRMNQQQQEQKQRDQQIEQQQQQEQLQRQQQQQAEQQQRQQQQNNRTQQDNPRRQEPKYQGPPTREQRTEPAPQQQQRTERRQENNNGNQSGGFFSKKRGLN